MPRSTIARIDLDALRRNFQTAQRRAGGARVMAVVKADGYGHGIGPVASALDSLAPKYAVACLEEARAIRETGLIQPVVLLQGVHAEADIDECARNGFEPVFHSFQQLAWLERLDTWPAFWLKVNSGMNRLGFHPDELAGVMSRLQAMSADTELLGFVTHFACAADPDSAMTAQQTAVFEKATSSFPDLMKSVANSAAHFRPGQPMFDWSRPGHMLYGGSPMVGTTGPDLLSLIPT